MKKTLLLNQKQLEELAERTAESISQGESVFLTGELGAGKSVFARAFLCKLGVNGDIPSPSFIVNAVYFIDQLELHHIDLYRLNGTPAEMELYGIGDALMSNSICIIEWADRLEDVLKEDGVFISIEFTHDSLQRKVFVDDRRMARN